jgi:hypothetical protein
MDTALAVMVAVLVGAAALGFYMDWFGLWVSEAERREQIGESRERMRRAGAQAGDTPPGAGPEAGKNPVPGRPVSGAEHPTEVMSVTPPAARPAVSRPR